MQGDVARTPIMAAASRRALLPPGSCDPGGQAGKATAMAKSQQKSNREAKKPKKEKPKPSAGARSDLTATLEGGKTRKK